MENKTLRNLGDLVLGAALFSIGYLVGNYNGFNNGRVKEIEDLIINLSMDRYDLHQKAKCAGNLERQNEILKDAETVSRTFELLDKNEYFYRDNFLYQDKLKSKEKEK